ncbi:MAG: hypothetical protein JNK15_05600 [Planctomycetes bacterium]|nr:hypothetical protein [Planctomycetota bacterium]
MHLRSVAASAFTLLLLATTAAAQCGTTWRPGVPSGGLDGEVQALLTMPNGDIVAGGLFQVGDSNLVNNIARFDGTTWQPLGSGTNAIVRALAVLPNGDLVAGGEFTQAGGVAASRIARWDGTAWSALGAGCNGTVYALCTLANGELAVGGAFSSAGGNVPSRIASWNGSTWSALGTGLSGPVLGLTRITTGELIAGGSFTGGFARWNGANWAVVPGLSGFASVADITALPGGLFAAVGGFAFGLGPVATVAVGSATSVVPGPAPVQTPNSIQVLPNGDIAVGTLGATSNGATVQTWNGTVWQELGTGTPVPHDLTLAANGDLVAAGRRVIVASQPTPAVARHTGGSWNRVGQPATPEIYAMAKLPNGDVVLGGSFTSIGGTAANFVARRSGNTYSPLGLGVNGPVLAMDVSPDGSLVVAGSFTLAGGGPAVGVARWSNGIWSSVGSGTTLTPIEVAAGVGGQVLLRGTSSLRFYDGSTWSQPSVPGVLASIAHDPDGGFVVGGQFGFPYVGTVHFEQGGFSFTINQPLVANVFGHDAQGRVLAAVDFTGSARILRLDGTAWTQLGPDLAGRLAERITTLPNGDVLVATKPFLASGGYDCELWRLDGSAWVLMQGQLRTTPPSAFKQLDLETTGRGELLLGGFLRAMTGQVAFSLAIADAQCPASLTTFGSSCVGSNGPLALQATQGAWAGGTFSAQATGFAANALAVHVVGTAGPFIPLLPSGGGCYVFTTTDILSLLVPTNGAVDASFAVPRNVALAGVALRTQVVGVEITNGAVSRFANTNALDLVVGSW